jgi:hypothetical protein
MIPEWAAQIRNVFVRAGLWSARFFANLLMKLAEFNGTGRSPVRPHPAFEASLVAFPLATTGFRYKKRRTWLRYDPQESHWAAEERGWS